MDKSTYYITTPIFYPNDRLHIGHAYSATVTDTLARYKRLRGFDVRFLTGTDENAQKVQRKAQEAGKETLQFVDEIVASIQSLWRRLGISYDDYIRTTEPRHQEIVQKIFTKLQDQGDIYLGEYEGWYCTPDESYWTERQLVDGKCPDCGREVERVREKSYFFRMSRYADRLIAHYQEHPEFIVPESRKNEMLQNFLLPGLEDLCVSRAAAGWGIEVPGDPQRVIYVWLDALTNYITALGYLSGDSAREALMARYWPADVHMMAKEIVRFHAIYWPIILMALDLPLPKQVVGHGWLLMKDGKMSKSKGNVVDPNLLIDRYSADALRYFLLRDIAFGQDGVFTLESMMERLNYDLANDLGNLLHRTLSMVERFCGGQVPAPGPHTDVEERFSTLIVDAVTQVELALDRYDFSGALAAIWTIVRRGNQYIDEMAPWALNKAGQTERLGAVLYNTLDVMRIVGILLEPFMPHTPARIFAQLGLDVSVADRRSAELSWAAAREMGRLPSGQATQKVEPLFMRLDVEKEIAELEALLAGEVGKGEVGKGEAKSAPPAKSLEVAAAESPKAEPEGVTTLIGIEDFAKVELRVARVIEAQKIEKADKLLKLQLDLGYERRQVVSGIAKFYTPEELAGQLVILVANLKPVKLRGEASHGMILAASVGDQLRLATVAGDIELGAVVK
ncbi:MAG: methionine--tRNA ligase [Firmicutes bacterium]|nr:methionine--tRNA ligase [Bacillota bacterium]